MNVNKKRTTLIFVLINLIVLGLSFSMYFVFINAFEKKYEESYINSYQAVLEEKFVDELDEISDIFTTEITKYNINELNNLLNDENILSEKGFINFTTSVNNRFSYLDQIEINISNSHLKEYNFGFFTFDNTQYLYFYQNDIVGILYFSDLFNEIAKVTNANDVILMDNFGQIYFNYDKSIYKNVLHEYITDEKTDNYFHDYFSRNLNVVISTKINNKAVTMVFTPFEQFNKLYLGQQFYKEDIKADFANLHLFMISLFVILGVFNFVMLGLVYFLIDKKNVDIEESKLRHYYDKPYIIKINKKGNIVKVNERFKTDFYHDESKTVTDLFNNDGFVMDKINRGSLLIYNDKKAIVGFLPLKVTNGFYLVGDFLKGVNIADEEEYNLAYYDQTTNFGNKHLYNKETNELLDGYSPLSEDILMFVGLQVKDYDSISSYLGKRLNLAYQEMAKNLNDLIDEEYAKVYHTERDKLLIIFKNKTLKEVEEITKEIISFYERPVHLLERKIAFVLVGGIVPVEVANKQFLNSEVIYDQVVETLKRAAQSITQKYVIFDETITHFLTERQQTEKDLVEAIKKKEFIPYFQAQYNYKKDRIDGFEALIRWDHPNYFKKSPMYFIEVAEETELIDDIGDIMMEKTFKAAQELQKYDVAVSINVSPSQMLGQGFTEKLLNLYKKYKLKENSIAVEITESTLIHSFNLANDKIKILKRNGIRVDLDDFGTGYSSLPYIKELNFDTIKIDKTFVDYVETDRYNKAIVQMITSLGKTLNAEVIAEGVETQRQMNYLVRAGVDLLQGYFISKPVPLDEAIKLLEEYNVKKTISFKEKRR